MLLLLPPVQAATLSVGPSGSYPMPCKAVAAASAGDVIEVDASGNYAGDTCSWSTDNLTIRGVNGRPLLDGTGASMAEQKGIFVIHAEHATIENLAFKGASVADANGAGIRHQGTNLTVRNCLFQDNENGILGSPIRDGTGSVEIANSEFDHNGAGDGYSHNLYLGHYASVSFRASYSHRGNVGHLFKSRAAYNAIVASRLTDEDGGTASYEIDLPNGGESWIVGSLVEQVGTTQNSAILAYGEEGVNGKDDLHIVNSTIVNHHSKGSFLNVGGSVVTPVEMVNTLLSGPGTRSSQSSTVFTTCWDDSMGDPLLVDPVGLDLHLQAASPLIDAGSPPPIAVDAEYQHPASEISRTLIGSWDIGAYEYGSPGDTGDTGDSDDTATDSADTNDTAPDDDPSKTGTCGCNSQSGGLLLALIAPLFARRRLSPDRSSPARPLPRST